MERAINFIAAAAFLVCAGICALALIAGIFILYGVFFGLIGGGAVWAYRLIA